MSAQDPDEQHHPHEVLTVSVALLFDPDQDRPGVDYQVGARAELSDLDATSLALIALDHTIERLREVRTQMLRDRMQAAVTTEPQEQP